MADAVSRLTALFAPEPIAFLPMSQSDDNAQALETAQTAADDSTSDYFAQMRLSRQKSRGDAVDLLEQTIAYDDGTQVGDTASQTLNSIVSTALSESQIESLIVAKGYEDCVAYIADGTISIAVSAPADGLTDDDVALISDVVASQTDFSLSQLRIIEVKS